ncbi:MAG: saccharopine dehydrogenase [Candidatus Melainabacteria bacterium HGW-Melainabacteria-1]|nr:MAG: saccharopine dehydrogenase [Candidatus Melainabacteria bacterium HGW-Melainabacteria-1]
METQREFDVVLYGATGFTGKQAALYYAANVPRTQTRWALAGRSLDKLELLRKQLGDGFEDLPLLCADSHDSQALRAMTARCQVVQTTVGPYARYGEELVKACIETGTDYVDITGETPWVRHLIDSYHAQAQAAGVRIVNFCGVDSVPSDLGAFLLASVARSKGDMLGPVQGLFNLRGGGLNGGTLASALNMLESGQLALAQKPFLLNPGSEQDRIGPIDQKSVNWNADFWVWTTPFVMAPVNTRVVRRSEALYRLAGMPYGPDFKYDEAMWMDELLPAASLGIAGTSLLMDEVVKLPAVLKLLKQYGPKPGEGPSEAVMNRSNMSVWFSARTRGGHTLKASFFAEGDPGNRVTVKLLSESALTLVHARHELPSEFGGGILTPATALGQPLITRLRAAGIKIDVKP